MGIPVGYVSLQTFHRLKHFLTRNNLHRDYVRYLVESNTPGSPDFVALTEKEYIRRDSHPKLIAFYLPQFHAIPLNDQNFGRGFTEWSNVTRAIPHFIGHYQPQLPIDTGFYDLRTDTAVYRQIELAKLYGIYGFCFHYYWFSGVRLLEKPLFNFLQNKELKFPFCLCWANENWATLWDGRGKETVMEHKHLPDDYERFFYGVLPFLQDERYIKIQNKPVLVIYKTQVLHDEEFAKLVATLRNLARKNGLEGLFLLTVLRDAHTTPEASGLDGFIEFPPPSMQDVRIRDTAFVNYKSSLRVLDMEDYIVHQRHNRDVSYTLFKGLFPSWDNTARKAYSGGDVYYGETPSLYKQWLTDCIRWTQKHHPRDSQLIFINAWNEWAEGAHLEPDQKFGYAYLQATKDALERKDDS